MSSIPSGSETALLFKRPGVGNEKGEWLQQVSVLIEGTDLIGAQATLTEPV